MQAQDVSTLSWSQVCSGKMGTEWYGTDEAQRIADDVLYVQKVSGGWMKNDELHTLTSAQKQALYNKRNEHSCLDNTATTQEMRFLAKVYKQTGIEKYKTAFMKGLSLILTAEKGCGGWSQYWPLSGNGSYQDYITFNDNLTTNVMKLLQEIIGNKGDFENLVDAETRARCEAAFQKGLEVSSNARSTTMVPRRPGVPNTTQPHSCLPKAGHTSCHLSAAANRPVCSRS